ncbi:MAG TPA: VOC family protein [Terriglobales bacterium]|nr:VOC family protein [Terriglobales bacterium]
MARQSLIEQLDKAVQAILDKPDALGPQSDARLAALVRVADELRDLPRPEFKVRLKTELERRTGMANQNAVAEQEQKKVSPVPKGYHTITPYLVAQDAPALIDFMKKTFGAEQSFQAIGSAGGIHAEVRLGDSMLMVGGGGPGLSWRGESMVTGLHVYVQDTNAVYQRALEAGGVSIDKPTDHDYGERGASVKDQAGNHWYIATAKGKKYIPEGLRNVNVYLHPRKAEPLIDFLKRAFGAEEIAKYASPDGVINHAAVKIGDSILEMGEAHGPYQPMPTMFYLYVPNVDELYRRAIEAGGTLIGEPTDHPYGDRSGGVKDAFGNQWYIATHIKDV